MVNSNSKTRKKFSHLGLLIQRMRNYTVPRNQFHGIENAPNQLLQNAMKKPDSRCPTENIKTATETARQAIKADAYKLSLPLSRPNPIPATLFSHPTSFYYSTMASNAKASRNTIQMIRDMNYAFRPVEERIHRRSDRKSEELQKQIKQRTIKHKKERKDAITAKLKDFIQGTPLEDMSKDESLEFQESVQKSHGHAASSEIWNNHKRYIRQSNEANIHLQTHHQHKLHPCILSRRKAVQPQHSHHETDHDPSTKETHNGTKDQPAQRTY